MSSAARYGDDADSRMNRLLVACFMARNGDGRDLPNAVKATATTEGPVGQLSWAGQQFMQGDIDEDDLSIALVTCCRTLTERYRRADLDGVDLLGGV